MKKITLQFENGYYGKFDTIKKEIDCEFQAGNASLSDELQIYSIQRALCLSIYDFVEKIGLDAETFCLHLQEAYKTYSGNDDVEPDANFVSLDKAITNSNDLESFTKQFNESAQFRKMVFDIFQDSMDDD